MIIVTGGAGMIGSNIIKALNDKGYRDILVVDNLKDGTKFVNLVDLDIADYIDKEDFIASIVAGDDLGDIEAVFHEGACSATTEWDGKYMMDNNYQYSKDLLHYCLDREIPFLYASSAATYGGREEFIEEREYEAPLNVYGYSKFLFNQYVRDPAGSGLANLRLPLLQRLWPARRPQRQHGQRRLPPEYPDQPRRKPETVRRQRKLQA